MSPLALLILLLMFPDLPETKFLFEILFPNKYNSFNCLKGAVAKLSMFVILLSDKSFNTIISILAILKSGGAYLPILPDYPTERIDFMLADSGSKFLITQKEYKGKYKFDGLILCADDEKIYN